MRKVPCSVKYTITIAVDLECNLVNIILILSEVYFLVRLKVVPMGRIWVWWTDSALIGWCGDRHFDNVIVLMDCFIDLSAIVSNSLAGLGLCCNCD